MIDPTIIKQALSKLTRYNRINDDEDITLNNRGPFGMTRRKKGKWFLREDVMNAIGQIIADAERNEN